MKIKTILTAIIGIIAILLVVGAIGFLLRFTNGGTTELKTFYVDIDGKSVTNDTEIYLFCGKPLTVTPKYMFSSFVPAADYKYSIVPHQTEETAFDYTVDGKNYSFSQTDEVTKAFKIEPYNDGFTICNDFSNGNVMREVLERLHEGKNIGNAEIKDMDRKVYFDLIISNYNNSLKYVIGLKFPVDITAIEIDNRAVLFNDQR